MNSATGFIEKVSDGVFVVKLLKEYYGKNAVLRTVNMYLQDYFVKVDSLGDYVGVWFQKKRPNTTDDNICTALKCFCNDVIDQQVKEDLNSEFGGIRETIYHYAFDPINSRE